MKKILIVDDSPFMRTVLKDLLLNATDGIIVDQEIEIYEADGKANALKQLKNIKPNLILLDIVMQESETEGVDFIKEIKDAFNLAKVVIISSVGQFSVLEECKLLGVKYYLQKPFDRNEVITIVNKVLSS